MDWTTGLQAYNKSSPGIVYRVPLIYSVLVSVLCPRALYHLESDNIFCITVVVADWLG